MQLRRTIAVLGCAAAAALVAGGCGGDGGGSADASDTLTEQLTLGEAAILEGPSRTAKLSLTVTAEAGTPADLKDFRLEEDEKTMTPWYVTSVVENQGEELSSSEGVSAYVEAFDDSGKKAKEIALLGEFPRCELVNAPDPFPAGASYTSCEVYLVPQDATLGEVRHLETRFEEASVEYVWSAG